MADVCGGARCERAMGSELGREGPDVRGDVASELQRWEEGKDAHRRWRIGATAGVRREREDSEIGATQCFPGPRIWWRRESLVLRSSGGGDWSSAKIYSVPMAVATGESLRSDLMWRGKGALAQEAAALVYVFHTAATGAVKESEGGGPRRGRWRRVGHGSDDCRSLEEDDDFDARAGPRCWAERREGKVARSVVGGERKKQAGLAVAWAGREKRETACSEGKRKGENGPRAGPCREKRKGEGRRGSAQGEEKEIYLFLWIFD